MINSENFHNRPVTSITARYIPLPFAPFFASCLGARLRASTEVRAWGWNTAFIGQQTEVAKVQNLGQMSPRLEPRFAEVPTSVLYWPILTRKVKVLDPCLLDMRLFPYFRTSPSHLLQQTASSKTNKNHFDWNRTNKRVPFATIFSLCMYIVSYIFLLRCVN